MRLLIFVDWYLPGYKAGGQISSCSNIVYALKDQMDISIITRDRDLDDTIPYTGITADTWQQQQPRVKINYVSPGQVTFGNIKKLIREAAPDTIYFNSMFSYRFTLLPLVALKSMKQHYKIVLAPRGMLQHGAMHFKTTKKTTTLSLLYYAGLLKQVVFHATDEVEEQDIKNNIKGTPRINMVYDFPAIKQEPFKVIEKKPGYLDCLFVSRVVGKKNLLHLLQVMAGAKSNITLTIAGPVEDKNYWDECLQQIALLPANCTVNYTGPIPNNQLPAIYRKHHLFVLPTLGENFGHVIFDAFLNGRPVLVSDQTPWRGLEAKKIGMDISNTDKKELLQALELFAAMQQDEFTAWCNNAWLFAQERVGRVTALTEQYKSLFS
jgi:hypothetical protein